MILFLFVFNWPLITLGRFIRLSGPQFPQPGEKLYEEKLMAEEGMKTTKNKLIFIGKPIEMDDEEFKKKLAKLDDDSQEDDENIREYVMDIVPTYKPASF